MPEQISILQAFILGVVEGITEFLPISSTGHLLVTSQLLDVTNTSGTFEIVIQLGAIIAVMLFYWKKLYKQAIAFPKTWQARRFWFTLLVAFLPAAFVGLAIHDLIEELLGAAQLQAYVIAATLIIGGFILWAVDKKGPESQSALEKENSEELPANVENGENAIAEESDNENITFKQALWIGIAQCFSLLPGVSRSGATIVGGLLVGLNRQKATEFSFYLSIPTLGAATVYTLIKNYDKLAQVGSVASLAVGTVIAFITALLAIGWLLNYVSNNDFKLFAVYRVLAGLAILVWAYCVY